MVLIFILAVFMLPFIYLAYLHLKGRPKDDEIETFVKSFQDLIEDKKKTKTKLNKNLSFVSSAPDLVSNPTLLVLFGWLFAKERHLEKYRKLYSNKGFDVLIVETGITDCLVPSTGSHVVAKYVCKFIEIYGKRYERYLFHAFSVGSYQLGEVLVTLSEQQDPELFNKVQHSLKGIIFDSAIDVREAPIGLSRAVTDIKILQIIIKTWMQIYMYLFEGIVTKYYINSSNSVHKNTIKCPLLVLLSLNDLVANPEKTFEAIEQMKRSGIKVYQKCWENSLHVSHYFKYPDEYQAQIDLFLINHMKE